MRTILTTAAIIGLTLAPAMAQTSTTTPSNGTPSTNSQNTNSHNTNSQNTTPAPMAPGAMQETLKTDLSKAGFTDIQVMPSSFLVRAKDKNGHPIMMVINPDSVTEISNIGKPAAATTK